MESITPELKIEQMLQPLLEDTDMFVTSIRIKPTNNIKVFLDADNGLNIEKSAGLNKRLYALIEDSGMYPDGDFSLEVSSPGIDEPLTQHRQYLKNIGRTLELTLLEGPELTGVLQAVEEDRIRLELSTGKKKEISSVEIPIANIKKAVVQVVF